MNNSTSNLPKDFDLVLRAPGIQLRPMAFPDFDAFLKLTQTHPIWKFFTQDLSDEQTLVSWMKEGLDQKQKQTRIPLTIVDAAGAIMGSTSLGNISKRDKRIEIGWTWLGRAFQGKGINDQVKYLLLEYAFEQLLMERVECKTDVLNQAARGALCRMGFQEEGILRSHTLMTQGRRRDTIFYSILKHEWPAVKLRLGQTLKKQ